MTPAVFEHNGTPYVGFEFTTEDGHYVASCRVRVARQAVGIAVHSDRWPRDSFLIGVARTTAR